MQGEDHHAKVLIDLEDAYRGAERSISLRVPEVEARGPRWCSRSARLDVHIPKGIRAGQHLRLAGQGEPGIGGAPAGDLYLEIEFNPHAGLSRRRPRRLRRSAARALGGGARRQRSSAATPEGTGAAEDSHGLVGGPQAAPEGPRTAGAGKSAAGDLYAVLTIALPPATSEKDRDAYDDAGEQLRRFQSPPPTWRLTHG